MEKYQEVKKDLIANEVPPKKIYKKYGITEETAKNRISTYGLNEVDYDKAPAWYTQLIKSFANPFIVILIAIVVISYLIDVWFAAPGEEDWKTVIVIAAMILVSSLLSFFQEYRKRPMWVLQWTMRLILQKRALILYY